jgi:hypothetical protein
MGMIPTPERKALLTAVLAAILGFSGCSLFDPAELGDHGDFSAEFDLVWQAYDQNYVGLARSGVDWDESYEEFSARIDTVTCQEGFMTVMHDMLSAFRDPSIVTYDPTMQPDSAFGVDVFTNCDSAVLMSYFQPDSFQWFAPGVWGYAMLQDSIPYVVILNWSSSMYPQDLTDMLELNPDAPALVIDQRLASGGSRTQLRHVGKRFNEEARTGFYTIARNGLAHDDFCAPIPYLVPSTAGYFDRPVAVLIGEANSGAALRFACMADEIPSVTLIGDTTLLYSNFSSGLMQLPAGWMYSLPDSSVLLADSVTWVDGIGVAPDIYVEATPEDFSQGIDPVLEHALDWAASRGR